LATPLATQAALTENQIQSVLALLQAFGADQATISNVNLSLRGQPTSTPPAAQNSTPQLSQNCAFTRDLSLGSNGADVKCLQTYLKVSPASGYFGTQTKSALIQWQSGNGISPATGYFGPLSRAKFNSTSSPINQNASGSQTNPNQNQAPQNTTTPQDYKLQSLAILNNAKDDYLRLENYAKESESVVTGRQDTVQRWHDTAANAGANVSDSNWQAIWADFAGEYQTELAALEKYQHYFEVDVPNVTQTNINDIDSLISTIQNYEKPITYDQMMAYQITYFGSNRFQNNKDTISAAVTQIEDYIDQRDALYNSQITALRQALDKQSAAAYETPQYITQYQPPTIVFPQPPQTTHCTISGDGGVGLQAYVNCSTY
jgi:Putative peptidoglycan binding domain